MSSETWTCASPAYLTARGTPASVADLGDHTLIAYSDRATTWGPGPFGDAVGRAEFLPGVVVSDSAALLRWSWAAVASPACPTLSPPPRSRMAGWFASGLGTEAI